LQSAVEFEIQQRRSFLPAGLDELLVQTDDDACVASAFFFFFF
jgi:hypothetical protein